MPRRTLFVLLSLTLLVASSCNQSPTPPAQESQQAARSKGGVGVVDMDAVAKALGKDMAMTAEAEQKVAQINKELASLQDALNRQFADTKEELGSDLSDEDKRKLIIAKTQLENQFRSKKALAERKYVSYRRELVEKFREETKPILKEVAASHGLSIVIPKNDALLLTVATEVDLTDAVVVALQKIQPVAAKSTPAKSRRKADVETSARDDE